MARLRVLIGAILVVRTFGTGVPAHLHVGQDFHFGAKAAGAVPELRTWADGHGMQVHAHDLKSEDGAPISATRIRLLLADGKLDEANHLLGRVPASLHGVLLPVGRSDSHTSRTNLRGSGQLRPTCRSQAKS